MSAAMIRRLMRRQLDSSAIRESERNERVALEALALLVRRGLISA